MFVNHHINHQKVKIGFFLDIFVDLLRLESAFGYKPGHGWT